MAEWNEDDPLARIPGESQKANDALRIYWELGARRSIALVVQEWIKRGAKNPKSRILDWSSKHHWQARIARQQHIVNQAVEAKLQDRREKQALQELDYSDQLAKRALEILDKLPIVEKTHQDKDGRYVIKPASAKEYNAARAMLETAAKLARLALGLHTSHRKHTFEGMTDSELVEFIQARAGGTSSGDGGSGAARNSRDPADD